MNKIAFFKMAEGKETHRVQKLISNYGYCSRRKAEDLINAGRVKVNGKTIKIGDQATEEDKISIDGQEISASKKIYIAFNKPIGCVTALEDKHQKTIMEYIDIPERIFPIGRLDFNTSGLLILTNDGDFANLVMHPRYEVKKTYLAGTKEPVSDFEKKQLENGIVLEDGKTAPAKVKLGPKNTLEITIHEGKNRIIRRMLEALGHKVVFLERIKIGSLQLGNLEPGYYRHLSKEEREKVFK
jgi:23S rRNA pseudouridine2605 synthase